MSYTKGGILAGSSSVKVIEPVRMSPMLLIGGAGNMLLGSLAVHVSDHGRMSPF